MPLTLVGISFAVLLGHFLVNLNQVAQLVLFLLLLLLFLLFYFLQSLDQVPPLILDPTADFFGFLFELLLHLTLLLAALLGAGGFLLALEDGFSVALETVVV